VQTCALPISAPMDEKDDEPLIVSVDKEGNYFIELGGDPKQNKPLETIAGMVEKVLAENPQTSVLVWGDSAVDYGTVVSLMTRLQAAGAPSVGLVTDPPQ